jgi:16S rRNA (guanine527-N7)-methyltransferase
MTTGDALREYGRLLAAWPGLVSRTERSRVDGLIEDSLALLPFLGEAESVVDVGSGGGMPGIPLRIARPGLRVTLIESDARKAAFLVHACAVLGLDVEVRAERAEDYGRGESRERFDLAVSRALASLPVVAELCLPLLRVGGRMLAMKAEAARGEELAAGGAALAVLGGGPPVVRPASSGARPGGVVVEAPKLRATPDAYPRRAGVPARRPLASDAG